MDGNLRRKYEITLLCSNYGSLRKI